MGSRLNIGTRRRTPSGIARSRPNALPPDAAYALPASLVRTVREQADAIQELLSATSRNVVQIGLRLQFVRDRVGRAHFQPWLKSEFRWSQSVASNYMRAAKAFADADCVERFQPGALFVLARKRCPAAARAEAVRLARRGERVTKAAAVAIVGRHSTAAASTRKLPERVRRYLIRALKELSDSEVEMLVQEIRRALLLRTGDGEANL